MKKYNIIYADPPWKYKNKALAGNRGAGCKYNVMSTEDIKKLPVNELAAEDCMLFIWVTMPKLNEVFDLIEHWGFTYKTCGFNWVKKNRKADSWFMGLGYWTRSNSEICLLGTKGHPSRVSRSISQICDARIMAHSKKPDEIRERIVDLCGNLPGIELFAREKCEGWVSIGNEIDGKDIREAILEV